MGFAFMCRYPCLLFSSMLSFFCLHTIYVIEFFSELGLGDYAFSIFAHGHCGRVIASLRKMTAFPDIEKGSLSVAPRISAMNSRSVYGIFLTVLLIFVGLSLNGFENARKAGDGFLHHYKGDFSSGPGYKPKGTRMARRLKPEELMQRALARDLTSIPKILHQSWINETLPVKFEEWSASCRMAQPDWEWVLWTDEDNLRLVERYAP